MLCGRKTEIYSRVVGYHNPIQHWNKGKQEEFKERVEFSEDISLSSNFVGKSMAESKETQVESSPVSVSKVVETYKLFSLPKCEKCTEVKSYLKDKSLVGEEIDLKDPEGKKIFQEYYKDIRNQLKRNNDNSVVLPVMLTLDNENNITNILQTLEDVKGLAS